MKITELKNIIANIKKKKSLKGQAQQKSRDDSGQNL